MSDSTINEPNSDFESNNLKTEINSQNSDSSQNSEKQELKSKVYLSKEEAEAECKFHTHNSLLELGRQIEKDNSKKDGLESLYVQLQDKFKDFPEFDLNQVDNSFNLDSYLYLNFFKNHDGFNLVDKKQLYQLYILYLLSENKIKNHIKENKLLNDEIDDLNEQGEDYIKQLEELENSNKEKESKIAKRIINLRQKCIDRKNQINRMWYLIFFLCYTSVFTLEVTLFQIYTSYYNMILPILQYMLIFNIICIKYIITFLIDNKIILGMLISFISTYCYFKYNKKVMLKKEN